MFYHYFALLAHDKNENVDVDKVKAILEKMPKDDWILFGNDFRVSNKPKDYEEFFLELSAKIDKFIKEFYEKSGIEHLCVYTSEHIRIVKHSYIKGKWDDKEIIHSVHKDDDFQIMVDINSLWVKCNLTKFYNKEYKVFEYEC